MRGGSSLLARLAGVGIGASIAFVVLAIQVPPAQSLWLTLAGVSSIAGVVLATVALRAARAGADGAESRIREHGLLGRATVLTARPTGRARGERTEMQLTLEVELPGRRRFTITRQDWLDERRRAQIVVGRAIPIAADPAEPGHVVLALENSDVNPAAIAGLGPFAGGPGGPGGTGGPGGRQAPAGPASADATRPISGEAAEPELDR
jgi:hypothetical protein